MEATKTTETARDAEIRNLRDAIVSIESGHYWLADLIVVSSQSQPPRHSQE